MIDASALFHQMGTEPRFDGTEPMYSYERPAYMFWSAFMDGLLAAGKTEAQAKEWLLSKNARWELDGELGSKLAALAFEYAKSVK